MLCLFLLDGPKKGFYGIGQRHEHESTRLRMRLCLTLLVDRKIILPE